MDLARLVMDEAPAKRAAGSRGLELLRDGGVVATIDDQAIAEFLDDAPRQLMKLAITVSAVLTRLTENDGHDEVGDRMLQLISSNLVSTRRRS